MGKLGKNEMMQLNPKTKMVFGTSAKKEGLFSAIQCFRFS